MTYQQYRVGLFAKNLGSMFLYFYLPGAEYLFYDTILICNECGAECTHVSTAIHFFLAIYPQCCNKLEIGVGNEWEGELVFLNKFFMRLLVLYAYTDNCIPLAEKFVIVVAQVACLG